MLIEDISLQEICMGGFCIVGFCDFLENQWMGRWSKTWGRFLRDFSANFPKFSIKIHKN